ncbi:MAG: hypothetical protein E7616_01310 [Ruminococcaceae bacterium]|nr:hypothetical protein [Oscillospiraceae bacterium]
MLIGPYFFIPKNGSVIYDACSLEKGELRIDKLDNPVGHELLWDRHFTLGNYVHYPRGRVIYDLTKRQAIIYIDKCIHKPFMIQKLVSIFQIDVPYTIAYDFHYQCQSCLQNLFD